MNEAPNFVALHPLASHVADRAIVEFSACYARINEQLDDRVEADIGNSADRPHRRAFAQHREDLDALRKGQLVHAPNI